MGETRIEWASTVWNPVTGCTKISPGCKNCYAARMSKRLAGRCGYPVDDPFAVTLHPDRLEQPLRWRKPRRVFVCSMSDLFHEAVPGAFIASLFRVMAQTPQHTYQILTKRPERMEWLSQRLWSDDPDKAKPCSDLVPLPNVWLGVSVENQRTAEARLPALLRTTVALRFVSVEPMLGAVDISPWLYSGYEEPPQDDIVSWVIVGCESGPGARSANPVWFRSLRDQCVAAGVPFFFKQMMIAGKLIKMPEIDGQRWAEMPERGGS